MNAVSEEHNFCPGIRVNSVSREIKNIREKAQNFWEMLHYYMVLLKERLSQFSPPPKKKNKHGNVDSDNFIFPKVYVRC